MTISMRHLLGPGFMRPISSILYRRTGSTSQPDQNTNTTRTDVINLYKNLIYLSRDWHTDLRPQIKRAFMKNKDVTDVDEIKKLIDKGEYICREIIATYHLRKYRAMKRRYYMDDEDSRKKQLEEMFKHFSN